MKLRTAMKVIQGLGLARRYRPGTVTRAFLRVARMKDSSPTSGKFYDSCARRFWVRWLEKTGGGR